MNNYITFDGLKYKTVGSSWVETEISPRNFKRLLSSKGDVAFCVDNYRTWKGIIIADAVALTGWGALSDLETAFRKKIALVMEDHYGISRGVTMTGIMDKRSVLPVWDSAENEFHVLVEITTL